MGTEKETKKHSAVQPWQDPARVWVRVAHTGRNAHPQEGVTHSNSPFNTLTSLVFPNPRRNTSQRNTGSATYNSGALVHQEPLLRDFSGAGWWAHGDNTYLAEQCRNMAVRREGSCWCPRSLASWAEDSRRVDDREKPQPSKGPVKVLHVHEDAMILEELFRNGSFQDSSQAPYDS